MTEKIFDRYTKKRPSTLIKVEKGDVTDFTKENIWVEDLRFCTGLVIYDSFTGLVAAGHDIPLLGENIKGRIPKSLDKMLSNVPHNSVAYAISTRDMGDVVEACERYDVWLQGFRSGGTYWNEETGETMAYKKDLIVDTEARKVYFFEKENKKAEWDLRGRS